MPARDRTDAMALQMPQPEGRIAITRLPVQLRMLVRIMGEGPAYLFVKSRGGVPYTVPKHAQSTQFADLVANVGLEPALALHAECQGIRLELPKYDSVLRQLRHQRVIELRLGKVGMVEIALRTGYSVRQVINIINAARLTGLDDLPERQADLFGEDLPEGAEPAEQGFEGGVGGPSNAPRSV